MTEHPRDDLAAFALGALDEQERVMVDAHVARCDSCLAEVEEYTAALVAYADAVDDTAPDLRARIVDREKRATHPVVVRGNAVGVGWLRRPVPILVPLALAVLLGLSLAGLVQQRRDADGYAAKLAVIPGARVVSLQPASGSDVRGSVVIPDSGTPFMILRLPAPPSGRVWEAWVLHGETPLPAGLAYGGGVVTITLTAPLGSGDGAAVTLEPAGGVDTPTSAPVLAVMRT